MGRQANPIEEGSRIGLLGPLAKSVPAPSLAQGEEGQGVPGHRMDGLTMTIKELKEMIADLPDDTPVFAHDSESGEYEAKGTTVWCRYNKLGWYILEGIPRKMEGTVRGLLLH